MQHRIEFRKITNKDIDENCRFMPEEEDFEIHLRALANDAEWLEGVTDVRRDGTHAIVFTTNEALEVFKKRLVPLLQENWAYLRIVL